VSLTAFRRVLAQDDELTSAFGQAWPLISATDLIGDLWAVPAYLRMCAPWLEPDEVRLLQRKDGPQAWTLSDLPLLDAARQRLGDPDASRRRRRQAATLAAERDEMSRVIDHLIENDGSDMHEMQMLRGDDLRAALVDDATVQVHDPDQLAGPFAHVVVDEAQELTDAEWQMLLLRCPSRSFTVVGDRAQARHGFTESWEERLERVGLDRVSLASLTINYRTPEEVMAEAEPVIRAALPDANVPTSVRSTGIPVRHGTVAELDTIVEAWLADHPEGIGCVIGAAYDGSSRVRSLTPALAKGLEFDLVVLVDPEDLGSGIEGAVDRYVAMTRATQQLVVLTSR
jgi:superfamily I DNA/RNA helicase